MDCLPECSEATGCMVGTGAFVLHTAASMVVKKALAKLSLCLPCGPSPLRPTIHRDASTQIPGKTPLEALFHGDAIIKEFRDTHIDQAELIAHTTARAWDFQCKIPLFVFGLSRQGKSSTINGILDELGSEGPRADTSDLMPCTHKTQCYPVKCMGFATTDKEEEILLFDTRGWEDGDKTSTRNAELLDHCIKAAQNTQVDESVLRHRLVLLCVLQTAFRGHLGMENFQESVRAICKQAQLHTQGQGTTGKASSKPVLVPILTMTNTLDGQPLVLRQTIESFFNKMKEAVGDLVEVRTVVPISREPGEEQPRPNKEDIRRLLEELAAVAKEQLSSAHILTQVQWMLQEDMMAALKLWEKKGRDPGHALVRRFAWTVARWHGAGIKHMYEREPEMGWKCANELCNKLHKLSDEGPSAGGADEWHTDFHREEETRLARPSSTASPQEGIGRCQSVPAIVSSGSGLSTTSGASSHPLSP